MCVLFVDFLEDFPGSCCLGCLDSAGNGGHSHWLALVQHRDGVADSLGALLLPGGRECRHVKW